MTTASSTNSSNQDTDAGLRFLCPVLACCASPSSQLQANLWLLKSPSSFLMVLRFYWAPTCPFEVLECQVPCRWIFPLTISCRHWCVDVSHDVLRSMISINLIQSVLLMRFLLFAHTTQMHGSNTIFIAHFPRLEQLQRQHQAQVLPQQQQHRLCDHNARHTHATNQWEHHICWLCWRQISGLRSCATAAEQVQQVFST